MRLHKLGVLLPTFEIMDGANVGFSCQRSLRVWMAQTCGSLASANFPNDYKYVDSVAVAIARTWDSLANVLNTARTDANSRVRMWAAACTLRERTRVHVREIRFGDYVYVMYVWGLRR